jgi:hypothetical protein
MAGIAYGFGRRRCDPTAGVLFGAAVIFQDLFRPSFGLCPGVDDVGRTLDLTRLHRRMLRDDARTRPRDAPPDRAALNP